MLNSIHSAKVASKVSFTAVGVKARGAHGKILQATNDTGDIIERGSVTTKEQRYIIDKCLPACVELLASLSRIIKMPPTTWKVSQEVTDQLFELVDNERYKDVPVIKVGHPEYEPRAGHEGIFDTITKSGAASGSWDGKTLEIKTIHPSFHHIKIDRTGEVESLEDYHEISSKIALTGIEKMLNSILKRKSLISC